MTSLSLTLLGPLQITTTDGRSLAGIESQKGKALLAYLATTVGQVHERQALALLLWPDKPAGTGRKNLRQALYNLRNALPPAGEDEEWLHITPQEVRFRRCQELWIDVHEFKDLIERVQRHLHPAPHACPDCAQHLQTAVDLYQNEFMAGFSLPDSDAYDQWQALQRETYHTHMMETLSHLATYYERYGETDAAIQTLRHQVELEPWREEAHYQLMHLLARQGQRAAALQQYERHQQHLATSLNLTPDEAITTLYHKIEAGEPLYPATGTENPYQGLDAFTPDRAAFFFGREASAAHLKETIVTTGLVGMFGPSGNGKSSLVQAGLLPRLTVPDAPTRWLTAVCRPGSAPLTSLAQALLGLHPDAGSSVEEMRMALESGETTLLQIAGRILATTASDDERPACLLLVIDSFEELYTLTADETVQHRFIDLLLATAVLPPTHCRVLLNLRADFISQALAYRPLADALQAGGLALGPMNDEEMNRAIVEPARLQGVSFERGLVARLLADIGDAPGRLPLLSFTLSQLWQKQEDGRLTHAAYEALGQLGGAVSQYANQVYEQLDDDEQQLAQSIFCQLVHSNNETADTRRPATRSELGEAAWQLVPVLADSRLIVSSRNSQGEKEVELVHEALLTHWDQLRTWLDKDRAFRLWQQRLRFLRQQWENSHRDSDTLLHGVLLTEAEAWLEQRAVDLSPAAQEFISASLARREARQQVEAERRQRELAQAQALAEAQRRRAETEATASRRLRTILALVVISLVVVSLIAFYAAVQRNDAQVQALLAGQAQTTAEAERALANSEAAARATEVAVRSTAEALAAAEAGARATEVAVRSTAEAQAISAGELLAAERLTAEQQARLAQSAQLVAESRLAAGTWPVRSLLLAVSANQILQPEDPYRPGAVQALRDALNQLWGIPLPGYEAVVSHIAVHPDSEWLVTADVDGKIQLQPWAAPLAAPRTLATVPGAVHQLVFSPDGHQLAAAGSEGVVYLWNLDDLEEAVVQLTGHTDMVDTLAFSADGLWLASGSRDGTTRLWDLADLSATPRLFIGEEGWIWRVVFSPNSEWLATGSFDGYLRLWSLTDPDAEPAIIQAHEIWIRALVFSPDGEWLVSGGADAAVKVWSTTTPETEPQVLAGHENHVVDIEFSPDGQLLAVASFDNTARVWRWANRDEPAIVLEGHNNLVKEVAFSPDGTLLATVSDDGTARLWSTADFTGEPVVLNGHDDPLQDVAFTPDGTSLITTGDDNQVRLWSLANLPHPLVPQQLPGHNDGVSHFIFSSDPDFLISTSYDKTAVLWESDTVLNAMPHESSVIAAALSPDQKWLATGTFDGMARLWSLADLEAEPVLLAGHTNEVWDVAFTPDGRFLASGSLDGTVRLWSAPDGAAIAELVHEGSVTNLAISPDGEWLAAAGGDPNFSASVWSLDDLEVAPVVLDGFADQTWDVDFSEDGRWLVVGSWDGSIRLYAVADLTASPMALATEAGVVDHVLFSPDGRWLVTAGQSLLLWSLVDLTVPPLQLTGHQRSINDLAFSPDGSWLATASRDQTARLWSLGEPQAAPQIFNHTSIVDSIAFSLAGDYLLTGTENGLIRKWLILTSELEEIACDIAGRSFLPTEVAQYFGDLETPELPCAAP